MRCLINTDFIIGVIEYLNKWGHRPNQRCLTYDKEDLHSDVTDRCAASQVIITNKAHIVGNSHSHIEGGQQN